MAKLSEFSEKDFIGLDAGTVRVKVTLPSGFALDAANSSIAFKIEAPGQLRGGAFAMETESEAPTSASSGLFSATQPATAYVLRFSRSTAQQFHELQTQLGNVAGGNVDIDVRVALSSKPAGATETSVWVDVLLTKEQGYIALIKAATLRLDGTDLHQSGRT